MVNKNWIGIFLIIIGLGFLLQQLDVFGFEDLLSMWWPVILIIIGIIQLISNPRSASLSGMIFILLGAIFLGNQFVEVNLFTYLWPLFLILIGFIFVFSRKTQEKITHSKNSIQNFSLFAGSNIRSNSQNFEGGEVTAIFGGAEIDLRHISIVNEAHLELTCIFGRVTIFVPENIKTEASGMPIFGGWENKTKASTYDQDSPVLYINCSPIFGGVEIKD